MRSTHGDRVPLQAERGDKIIIKLIASEISLKFNDVLQSEGVRKTPTAARANQTFFVVFIVYVRNLIGRIASNEYNFVYHTHIMCSNEPTFDIVWLR